MFSAAASGSPLDDGDNDGVADEFDVCPATAGDVNNYGCPAGAEVVRVHGFFDGSWLDDYAICPDGSLQVSYRSCPDYGYWGEYYAAHFVFGVHQRTDKRNDGAGAPCGGNPGNPNEAGGCTCDADEVKAEVESGFFCRPTCPSGQTWADGAAYGPLFEGGGTCAVNSCVNERAEGYTRLEARPTISCFPDMHGDYVDNIALPTACYLLVGGVTGAVCVLTGSVTFGIACSATANVIAAAADLCPDYPWVD